MFIPMVMVSFWFWLFCFTVWGAGFVVDGADDDVADDDEADDVADEDREDGTDEDVSSIPWRISEACPSSLDVEWEAWKKRIVVITPKK